MKKAKSYISMCSFYYFFRVNKKARSTKTAFIFTENKKFACPHDVLAYTLTSVQSVQQRQHTISKVKSRSDCRYLPGKTTY